VNVKALGRLAPESKLFLAEGASEEGFIRKILEKHSDQQSVVFCFAGLGDLSTVLKSISGVPGINNLKSLGLMLDAEVDFNARVSSVIGHFANHNITLPPGDVHNSRVSLHGSCRIGVYISPGAGSSGRIEDTALIEIQETKLWSCVDAYAKCIESALGKEFDKKSIVQTYISTIKGDLCGLGRAFQANILNVAHTAYDTPRILIEDLIR